MDINITYHARRRYAKLKCEIDYKPKYSFECDLDCGDLKLAHANCNFICGDVDKEIRELFTEADEEVSTEGIVNRIISNNFEPTSYFRNGIYRFVVLEKDNTLVTIEKNTFTRNSKSKGFIRKSELRDRLKK